MKERDLILQARDIHAWYGSSHVLHGVSLDIARGETVGLLGRNGMGKSTLIRTLLGHVVQRDGQIVLAGHDMSRARPHEVARRGVAYVPEGRGVFPNLSVKENLLMAAKPAAAGDRRAWSYARVMETFPRLGERLTHLGGQLSGGEQQMLSIGRALMTQPELIILDEATEGLAPMIVVGNLARDRANPRRWHRHADRGSGLPQGADALRACRGAPEGAGRPGGTGRTAGGGRAARSLPRPLTEIA